jgi:hypothetical protein
MIGGLGDLSPLTRRLVQQTTLQSFFYRRSSGRYAYTRSKSAIKNFSAPVSLTLDCIASPVKALRVGTSS